MSDVELGDTLVYIAEVWFNAGVLEIKDTEDENFLKTEEICALRFFKKPLLSIFYDITNKTKVPSYLEHVEIQ